MIGYLDCSTGISGDKFLGALLDVGTESGDFTADDLRAIVASLAPEAVVEVERVVSRGVTATGVRVHAEVQPHSRTWAGIRELIESAELPERVRTTSLAAFEALAVAEAGVHGTTVDAVHFHEVGAIDSIVDMVGVCAGVHALGIDRLIVSAVAVGSGTVETSHGTLAVPAPATAALLVGIPILGGPAAGELTTPTGAALLRALADDYRTMPAMTSSAVGYGAGTRDIGHPNVCMLTLGTTAEELADSDVTLEWVVVLETNIDHLSPEELAFAAEELLSAGALDVWQTPIVMKKGRSAIQLSVLSSAEKAAELAARVMQLTGSLGVRSTPTQRYVAPREIVQIESPWGLVPAKIGGGRVRPEHDHVARIARESGLHYDEVRRTIEALGLSKLEA
jgi:pyridinium-3,5-bisthiocarboxylic acid mononucleotide nickel chelatase